MKVVIAPDKFKSTLDAKGVARAIEAGIKSVRPDIETVLAPMADGGEGTLDAMLAAVGGVRYPVTVTGPLGHPVPAEFGVLTDGTAVIEMAKASGFTLVPKELRDPLVTTTFGTGELIKAALDAGCTHLIIGIGGSATVDAGVGCAQALGVRALKADGGQVGFGGRELVTIDRIDMTSLDPRIKGAQVLVASDVENPLYGPHGAANVFARQKGATPPDIIELEQGLVHFSRIVKRDLGIDVSELPGAGAAGGLGAGLVAFLGAELKPGAELIMQAIGLPEKMRGADLVITGEGQIDVQVAYGKVPAGIASLAKKSSITTVAIAGRLGSGFEKAFELGIEKIYSLEQCAGSLEAALRDPATYLEKAAVQITREYTR